ncbi:MAG: serine hydrolase [Chitinophagaceae bacterium]|nr:MAG: serine hydrolase [Chitinophagaceae bacterium]
MKKISFALLLLHWFTAVTAQVSYSKEVQEQIARVENTLSEGLIIDGKTYTISERMKKYNVQGISVAVIDNYQLVWAKGYGFADKKENRKVSPNTLFEPGSISKSINAVGILKLAQDGKLDLYQDINQYLVSWKFPYDTVSHGKKINTARLLSHTAGLSGHGFPGYHRDSALPTIPQILDGQPPANTEAIRSFAEPGKESVYSGGGITISQLIMTDITKQSYETYMAENVLRPLGMKNSFYNQPPAGRQEHLATGYKADGSEVAGKYFVYPEKAAAGLWTTPTDIAGYLVEMQLAYQGKSARVLNQDMVKLHVTPYENRDAAMGTFLQVRNGEKYFVHSASNEGFTGYFLAGLTNGKGIALFANSDDGYVLLELLNSVAAVYDWPGFAKPEQVSTVPVHDTLLEKYTGDYITDGIFAEVKKEKDGLYYWIDGYSAQMYFTSPNEFRNIEFRGVKTFVFAANRNVSGISRKFNGKDLPPAQRVTLLDTLQVKRGQWSAYGWHLLETKRFEKARLFLSKGFEHDAADSTLLKNLAHACLFSNDFPKAMDLYRQYLSSDKDGKGLRETLKRDFEGFRKNELDGSLIDRAKNTLQLTD